MEGWLPWILQTITMLGVGAIGWFIKQTVAQARATQEKHEKQLAELEDKQEKRVRDIEDKLEQLPYLYVLRDDFIRAVANIDSSITRLGDKLDQKIDKVLEQVNKQGGK